MLAEYLGILLLLGCALALPALALAVSRAWAPRSSPRARHDAPDPMPPRGRQAVRFHLVAVLFLVFNVGLVLVLPWAVRFRSLGSDGALAVACFGATFVVALVYHWRKRGLDC